MVDETALEHDITSVDELRQIIGSEVPGLAEKNIDHIDEFARAYIARSPFLVLATCDRGGRLDASPKGDAPGFVEVVDSRTLWVPDRPGNKLAYGHQNVIDNPRVGIIFMVPGTPETLRVNGRGVLTADPSLLDKMAARGKPATLVLKVQVEEVFFHCAKAFIRSKLWQSGSWGERHKISFGEMFASKRAKSQEEAGAMASAIDAAIATDYERNL